MSIKNYFTSIIIKDTRQFYSIFSTHTAILIDLTFYIIMRNISTVPHDSPLFQLKFYL